MSSLTTLPDICVLAIFDNLPILDLVHIDEVCQRFGPLKKEACNRRKSLTILVGDKAMSAVKQPFIFAGDSLDISNETSFAENSLSSLQVLELDCDTAISVQAAFRNLTTLIVGFTEAPKIGKKVIYLLKEYAASLITLKLYVSYNRNYEPIINEEKISEDLTQYIQCINKMTSLKRLTFLCNNLIFCDYGKYKSDNLELSILGQLEEFLFISRDSAIIFYDSLIKHGLSNGALKQIAIGNDLDNGSINKFIELDHSFANRFSQLSIDYNPIIEDVEQVHALFCRRFQSLTTLSIDVQNPSLTMASIADGLVSLVNLTNLNLKDNMEGPAILIKCNAPKPTAILSQIKNLHLTINSISHRQVAFLHLPFIFPNLEAMTLLNFSSKCTSCKTEFVKETHKFNCDRSVNVKCIRLFLKPFKKLSKLTKLVVTYPLMFVSDNISFDNFPIDRL